MQWNTQMFLNDQVSLHVNIGLQIWVDLYKRLFKKKSCLIFDFTSQTWQDFECTTKILKPPINYIFNALNRTSNTIITEVPFFMDRSPSGSVFHKAAITHPSETPGPLSGITYWTVFLTQVQLLRTVCITSCIVQTQHQQMLHDRMRFDLRIKIYKNKDSEFDCNIEFTGSLLRLLQFNKSQLCTTDFC